MPDQPLPTVFRTRVVRTERLGPHLVRVVVTGDDARIRWLGGDARAGARGGHLAR